VTRPINTNALLAQAAGNTGRKGLPLTLAFSASATVREMIADEIFAAGVLGIVQGVFIDNSDGAHAVVLNFPGVESRGYRIKCPAATQMWMPVPVPPGAFELVATGTIGETVYIELFNVPVAPFVWPSANIANVTANIAPIDVAFTDHNKILTGGADAIMNANAARQYLFLKNRVTNANAITVNFAGGASFVLAPGEKYESVFAVNDEAITATGTAADVLEAIEA
jgi:hypothetical protein